jgi:hypothetical protein
MYLLHHQGDKNRRASNDDGRDIFHRNVGSYKSHMGVTFQKNEFFIVTALKPQILHIINRLGSVAET